MARMRDASSQGHKRQRPTTSVCRGNYHKERDHNGGNLMEEHEDWHSENEWFHGGPSDFSTS